MSFFGRRFARNPFAAFWGTPDKAADANATSVPCRTITADGDYLRDATTKNIVEETDPVAQLVWWYLRNTRGSFPYDATAGNGVTKLLVRTDTSPVQIRDEVLRALAPLIERNIIDAVEVVATPYVKNGTAVAQYTVTYKATGVLA